VLVFRALVLGVSPCSGFMFSVAFGVKFGASFEFSCFSGIVLILRVWLGVFSLCASFYRLSQQVIQIDPLLRASFLRLGYAIVLLC